MQIRDKGIIWEHKEVDGDQPSWTVRHSVRQAQGLPKTSMALSPPLTVELGVGADIYTWLPLKAFQLLHQFI